MPCFVYILFCNQKIFYVGITSDIDKRLLDHKKGYSPYTRKFSEIELMYTEKCATTHQAKQRERQLKKWSIAKKKALIDNDKNLLITLSKSFMLADVRGRDKQ